MTDPNVISHAPQLVNLLSGVTAADPDDNLKDRARGVLLGLAAGNLLGLEVEGRRYDHISRRHPDGVTEIHPGEAHRPMDDDLAQAVDLGDSILTGPDYEQDFADRLITWKRVNGRGIGITTREVIRELERGGPLPEAARTIYERKNRIAPNGGVMRCAPVAIAHRNDPGLLVRESAVSCAVTHYADTCQWSCIIVNSAIAMLLNGVEPDLHGILVAAMNDGAPDMAAIAHRDGIPTAALDSLIAGEAPPAGNEWLLCEHRLIGHTLLAMEFGLWAAATPMGFEDALIASVAAGGDTDTNAAVAGAVLGARYGASAIPQRWIACIPQRQRIETLSDSLLALSTH